MKTIKKIACVIAALLLMSTICIPAFAEEAAGGYDYTKDERFSKTSDYENGEFVWGGKAPSMFQFATKKMFTLGNLPVNEDGKPLTDVTAAATPDIEGINMEVFYAFKCPACGKANGNGTIGSIYTANSGVCVHCGAAFPDPSTLTIYRFIVVAKDSAHYDTFKAYNLAKYGKDVYGATEKDYGDGKDLAQGNLVYDENGVLVDFTTGRAKNDSDGVIYMLLARLNCKLTPVMNKFVASKYTEIVYKIRVFFGETWEKILTAIVS